MSKKSKGIKGKYLGIAILIALGIQFILPAAGISGLGTIATLIYLFVGLYLVLT